MALIIHEKLGLQDPVRQFVPVNSELPSGKRG